MRARTLDQINCLFSDLLTSASIRTRSNEIHADATANLVEAQPNSAAIDVSYLTLDRISDLIASPNCANK